MGKVSNSQTKEEQQAMSFNAADSETVNFTSLYPNPFFPAHQASAPATPPPQNSTSFVQSSPHGDRRSVFSSPTSMSPLPPSPSEKLIYSMSSMSLSSKSFYILNPPVLGMNTLKQICQGYGVVEFVHPWQGLNVIETSFATAEQADGAFVQIANKLVAGKIIICQREPPTVPQMSTQMLVKMDASGKNYFLKRKNVFCKQFGLQNITSDGSGLILHGETTKVQKALVDVETMLLGLGIAKFEVTAAEKEHVEAWLGEETSFTIRPNGLFVIQYYGLQQDHAKLSSFISTLRVRYSSPTAHSASPSPSPLVPASPSGSDYAGSPTFRASTPPVSVQVAVTRVMLTFIQRNLEQLSKGIEVAVTPTQTDLDLYILSMSGPGANQVKESLAKEVGYYKFELSVLSNPVLKELQQRGLIEYTVAQTDLLVYGYASLISQLFQPTTESIAISQSSKVLYENEVKLLAPRYPQVTIAFETDATKCHIKLQSTDPASLRAAHDYLCTKKVVSVSFDCDRAQMEELKENETKVRQVVAAEANNAVLVISKIAVKAKSFSQAESEKAIEIVKNFLNEALDKTETIPVSPEEHDFILAILPRPAFAQRIPALQEVSVTGVPEFIKVKGAAKHVTTVSQHIRRFKSEIAFFNVNISCQATTYVLKKLRALAVSQQDDVFIKYAASENALRVIIVGLDVSKLREVYNQINALNESVVLSMNIPGNLVQFALNVKKEIEEGFDVDMQFHGTTLFLSGPTKAIAQEALGFVRSAVEGEQRYARYIRYSPAEYMLVVENLDQIYGIASAKQVHVQKFDNKCSLRIEGKHMTLGEFTQLMESWRMVLRSKIASDKITIKEGEKLVLLSLQQDIQTIAAQGRCVARVKTLNSPIKTIASCMVGGLEVKLQYGDIVESKAEVIVNAANKELKHNGGIAKAIIQKAGKEVEAECNAFTKSGSQVDEGDIFASSAGNFGQDRIILHAVGPTASKFANSTLELLITRCLGRAEQDQKYSIVIPPISSGIFNVPLDVVQKAICSGISLFVQQTPSLMALRKVYLLTNDISKAIEWQQYLKSIARPDTWTVNKSLINQLSTKPAVVIKSPYKKSKKNKYPAIVTKSVASASVEVPLASKVVWCWKDNDNDWRAYSREDVEFISKKVAQGITKFEMKIGQQEYTLDITAKKQTQKGTGFTRDIDSKVDMCQWEWKDGKSWVFYNQTQSEIIEKAYRAGEKKFTLKGVTRHVDDIPTDYHIDFDAMTQTNAKTSFARSIRKVLNESKVISSATTTFTEMESICDSSDDDDGSLPSPAPVEEEHMIRLKGFSGAIANCKQLIVQKIANMYDTKMVEINVDWTDEVIKQVEKEHAVKVTKTGMKLSVYGVKENTANAKNSLLEKALGLASPVVYPPEWSKSQNDIEIVSLNQTSKEYTDIVAAVHKTSPTLQVLKIERIENKVIWQQYYQSRQIIREKNGFAKDIDGEKWLFHGTRGTSPDQIYRSRTGFDMRFSPGGMWGAGTYFAENSSYSCTNYASTLPTGERQVFYARVATGAVIDLPPQGNLKMPPEKPNANAKFLGERYDCVSGDTNGSKVFIVYDNRQAYPSYLITFK